MAVFLELTYGKKLGLPAYSSHSFSITVRSEVADLKDVDREASKIYCLLQDSVDRQIVESGYTPVLFPNGTSPGRLNGHSRDSSRTHQSNSDVWNCSGKQHDLIVKIRDEHKLEMDQIEEISRQLFQRPAKTLNKLEASVLIKELLEEFGPKHSNGNGRRPYRQTAQRQS